jgi:hypothetical protein
MEHYRPKLANKKGGYYQGYYCGRCGAPGLSMMGRCTGYNTNLERSGVCIPNPKMVAILSEANTEKEEAKREFVRGLKRGQGAQRKNHVSR